jgi:hypothetical protein
MRERASAQMRVANRHLQGDAAAHAVADDVGGVDLQVTKERRRVVSHLLVGERAIGVRGAPVRAEPRDQQPEGVKPRSAAAWQ